MINFNAKKYLIVKSWMIIYVQVGDCEKKDLKQRHYASSYSFIGRPFFGL